MRSAIAVAACLASLALVNYSIAQKERLLAEGAVVYLSLGPVDPRSLMQGDYMALSFNMANSVARGATDGHLVAAVDERRVAVFRRLHDGKPLAGDEILLRYRVRKGQARFAGDAFFFEEGSAQRYAAARFGEFRVAPDGEMLLTALRDKDLKPL